MSEPLLLAQIARRAHVGRAAVVNWRRRHDDFPAPVGGDGVHPTFDADAVDHWLHAHGMADTFTLRPPGPPALLTLPDGTTVTLHAPWFRRDPDHGLAELGGGTHRDAWIPLANAILTRVQVEGEPPFAVRRAGADITDYPARYIRLLWRVEDEHPSFEPPLF
ncbi:hypothetical protein ACIF6L_35010 [Kitasatospora sp. NPDC086009]|uniref:hypothetical protein n=1 Tax=unclassified Kitasatospora TaxID=2633591 RepID=UPI0037CBEACC